MDAIVLPEHEARRQATLLAEMKQEAIFGAAQDIGCMIPESSPIDLWPLFLIRGLFNRVVALEEQLNDKE